MSKVFTPAQRKKLIGDLSTHVSEHMRYRFVDIEHGWDGGWLNPLQETILESIAAEVVPLIKQSVESYELGIEREENTKLKKLEAENRELKKELKKFAAIKKMIDDASGEVS